MEEEISLKEFYQIVKKHFLTILIAMVTGIIVLVLSMIFLVTPKYSSEAQLLVSQQTETAQSPMLTSEIQGNVMLINTYQDIIKGHSTLNKINENLGKTYSIEALKNSINVSQSSNSQAFNITVTRETAEEAQIILNELINVFEETIQGVPAFNAASTLILSPPSFNPNKVSPSLTMFVLIGAVIGIAFSVLIILIIELMDTTVKEDEYLTQLGLINLGHIYELSNKELKQSRLSTKNVPKRARERV